MTLWDRRPISPMMAKTSILPEYDKYLYEIKWDGLRAVLFLQRGKIQLQNRNLRDATLSYPELQAAAKGIRAKKAILDGEVVVLNEQGIPDFGLLQSRFGLLNQRDIDVVRAVNPTVYVAFDLLHLNGRDLVNEPLESRKQLLRDIVFDGPHLVYGDHTTENGGEFYSRALSFGFEGVVAKDRSSPYIPGTRSSYWIKVKGVQTLDAFVVGYTAGEGARSYSFGSLVMVMYDKARKMVHIANVGGGFDDKTLDELKTRLDKLVVKTPVIKEPIDAPTPVVWVRPKIVCEILYLNITRDKKLRFPRFNRLRPDKRPEDCVLDEDILSR